MDLTTGNIRTRLFHFAIPIIIMNILNQAYVVVDNIIVSQFSGETAFSIISSTSAILSVAYCLINGISSASHILIARSFGEKDDSRFKQTLNTIMIGSLIITVLIMLTYFLFGSAFLKGVSIPQEIYSSCYRLMLVYAAGLLVQTLAVNMFAALDGMGLSKMPMYIGVSTQLLNIILDYILIAHFGLGVFGAAYASIFSLCISALLSLYYVLQTLQYSLSDILGISHLNKDVFLQFFKLAMPSMLQQSIMSIGSLCLQKIVNMEGIEAIVGYTAAINLNTFLIIPVIAYTSAYETFAAQNIGANNRNRVSVGFKELLFQGGITSLAVIFVNIVGMHLLISAYIPNSDSYSYIFAKQYLLLLLPNTVLLLIKHGIDSIFKANMKVYLFTVSSFLSLGVRILLSYVFAGTFGLLSLSIATVSGTFIALIFNMSIAKKEQMISPVPHTINI